jgi:hypothetical protein
VRSWRKPDWGSAAGKLQADNSTGSIVSSERVSWFSRCGHRPDMCSAGENVFFIPADDTEQ